MNLSILLKVKEEVLEKKMIIVSYFYAIKDVINPDINIKNQNENWYVLFIKYI